jgi:hypothetical protein
VLSPRERVLTALRHEEPDRVPLSLWGSWYGITDELYFKVVDTLGWEPVRPFRPDRLHSVNFYDDRLLDGLETDVRHVDPGAIAAASGRQRCVRDQVGDPRSVPLAGIPPPGAGECRANTRASHARSR